MSQTVTARTCLILLSLSLQLQTIAAAASHASQHKAHYNLRLQPPPSYCNYEDPNGSILVCNDFISFEQLDFRKSTHAYNHVVISVNNKLNLSMDTSLSFAGLRLCTSRIGHVDGVAIRKAPRLTIVNVNAFQLDYNPFLDIAFVDDNDDDDDASIVNSDNLDEKQFNLEIANSRWTFFLGKSPSQSSSICNATALSATNLIFSHLQVNEFYINEPQFAASSPICPLAFKNSHIRRLTIQSVSPITYAQVIVDDERESAQLNITVDELVCTSGYDLFATELSASTLLNEHIFARTRLILMQYMHLRHIDAPSLARLPRLRELKLIGLDPFDLLENSTDWLNVLALPRTTAQNDAGDDDDESHRLFELTLELDEKFTLGDDLLCLFKSLRHHGRLVPLIDTSGLRENLENVLPCSCTVYWLYADYKSYIHLLDKRGAHAQTFPWHCFDVHSIKNGIAPVDTLIEEQIAYCNAEYNVNATCFPATSPASSSSVQCKKFNNLYTYL